MGGGPVGEMGVPEVNFGLLPGAGGTSLAASRGVQKALEMVTGGGMTSANEGS